MAEAQVSQEGLVACALRRKSAAEPDVYRSEQKHWHEEPCSETRQFRQAKNLPKNDQQKQIRKSEGQVVVRSHAAKAFYEVFEPTRALPVQPNRELSELRGTT